MRKIGLCLLLVLFMVTSCAHQKSEAVLTSYEKDVLIPCGDIEISATLSMPAHQPGEKVSCVVMMHGTGSNREEAGGGYALLAPALAEAGIASLRFDFPGSGDSTASYQLYTNAEAVKEAGVCFDWLASLADIDKKRVGVMGWSQGGTDALLAAARDKRFASVATWAGSLDLSTMVTDKMREEAAAKGYAVMEFEWRDSLELSQNWIEQVDRDDVLAEAAGIRVPVLMIHGSDDNVVPPSDGRRVVEAAKNPLNEWYIIDGADHTFRIFTDDKRCVEALLEKTVSWFKETL